MESLVNFFYKALKILLTLHDNAYGVIPVYSKEKDRLYLVTKSRSGRWVFPKGHSLLGEDDLKAARRELQEEVGITNPKILKDFSVYQNYSFNFLGFLPVKKTIKFFVGKVANKNVDLDEKEMVDYQWVNLEKAVKLLSRDSGKEILKKIDQKLNSLK